MSAELSETRLRENVSVWTLGGDRIESSYGANCTAVIGREAVLLVDPLIAPFSDARPCRPSLDFENDVLTLDLGDCEARVFHPGPGHTAGDAVVHLEEESVAICGDLVCAGYHVNYEDAQLDNLEAGLEALRALGARRYVPGHGAAGGAELLDAQLRYHRAVEEAAGASDPAHIGKRLRSQFPGYLLEEVIGSSVRVVGRE